MQWIQENFWIYMVIVGVLLVALVGLFIYLRKQQEEE
ncbi:MAG: LPXTG cell wall anchor domain-containing protein [Gemmatales bacterium]|nr:LPXTG cell wall anchor domain-containing protein [Gemmatales bacterium]MCS7160973.1 LPXTG cell wall anchor domain-containing protein [Gemmatales bacterium]MDW8176176.1 LPXTG cell wall anchor domain-containing protein [Gemmatales bacterium]MDW8222363.1 LPXTG cell wall anchor domain-containing protein [Gemmatales bacterium]